MRTYGRIYDEYGNYTWQVVTTDVNGYNDAVYLTTLVQVLQLGLGESPFYANYGIPAQTSLTTQVAPDYYVYNVQGQFSQYFGSLTISRLSGQTPMYQINVITQAGSIQVLQVPQ